MWRWDDGKPVCSRRNGRAWEGLWRWGAALDVWSLGSQIRTHKSVGLEKRPWWGTSPSIVAKTKTYSGLATSRRKGSKVIECTPYKGSNWPWKKSQTFFILIISRPLEGHQFTSMEDSNNFSALYATVCNKKLHLGRQHQDNTSCKDKEHISLRLFLPQGTVKTNSVCWFSFII